jgi:hypothetical protein
MSALERYLAEIAKTETNLSRRLRAATPEEREQIMDKIHDRAMRPRAPGKSAQARAYQRQYRKRQLGRYQVLGEQAHARVYTRHALNHPASVRDFPDWKRSKASKHPLHRDVVARETKHRAGRNVLGYAYHDISTGRTHMVMPRKRAVKDVARNYGVKPKQINERTLSHEMQHVRDALTTTPQQHVRHAWDAEADFERFRAVHAAAEGRADRAQVLTDRRKKNRTYLPPTPLTGVMSSEVHSGYPEHYLGRLNAGRTKKQGEHRETKAYLAGMHYGSKHRDDSAGPQNPRYQRAVAHADAARKEFYDRKFKRAPNGQFSKIMATYALAVA